MDRMDHARARGALLGLAVGDALGTTYEFSRRDAPAFPALARGPLVDIVGGGPFGVAPGQVTDDTQMACCLAGSLAAHDRLDVDDLAARYVDWMQTAFDVGGQTRAALTAIASGTPAVDAGRAVWLARGRGAAGNGSLMRTAPIAVYFAGDAISRREAALAESAVTHFDPRCRIACAAYDAAIAAAILRQVSTKRDVVVVAALEVRIAAEAIEPRDADEAAAIERAIVELRSDLDAALDDDPRLYSPGMHIHETQGFVRVAFRLAFWELVHAAAFRDAVIDAANRGGDSDTNAAIVGALVGAWHGEDAIPSSWRERVLSAPADRDEHHPAILLGLTAR